jgi:predicted alpha/beta-fold hydrolase
MKGNVLLTPYCFQHDISMDFEASIEFLRERFNDPSFYSVGFSMGANRLVKFAAKTKNKCPFKAIVGMGTPFHPRYLADDVIRP